MSNFLFIDTSQAVSTVAITKNSTPEVILHNNQPLEQAAVINLSIESALHQSSLNLKDLNCIMLCAGPGSYTGLRVGLSTVKGLCYALNIPFISYNRLQLIADDFLTRYQFNDVAVLLNARKGEYFMAIFNHHLKTIFEPQHVAEEKIQEIFFQYPVTNIVTDTLIDEQISAEKKIMLIDNNYELNVARWAHKAEQHFREKRFDNIAYSEPFYLKAAYTTIPKK